VLAMGGIDCGPLPGTTPCATFDHMIGSSERICELAFEPLTLVTRPCMPIRSKWAVRMSWLQVLVGLVGCLAGWSLRDAVERWLRRQPKSVAFCAHRSVIRSHSHGLQSSRRASVKTDTAHGSGTPAGSESGVTAPIREKCAG